jgi:AraC-like DNA-binding protein
VADASAIAGYQSLSALGDVYFKTLGVTPSAQHKPGQLRRG